MEDDAMHLTRLFHHCRKKTVCQPGSSIAIAVAVGIAAVTHLVVHGAERAICMLGDLAASRRLDEIDKLGKNAFACGSGRAGVSLGPRVARARVGQSGYLRSAPSRISPLGMKLKSGDRNQLCFAITDNLGVSLEQMGAKRAGNCHGFETKSQRCKQM